MRDISHDLTRHTKRSMSESESEQGQVRCEHEFCGKRAVLYMALRPLSRIAALRS